MVYLSRELTFVVGEVDGCPMSMLRSVIDGEFHAEKEESQYNQMGTLLEQIYSAQSKNLSLEFGLLISTVSSCQFCGGIGHDEKRCTSFLGYRSNVLSSLGLKCNTSCTQIVEGIYRTKKNGCLVRNICGKKVLLSNLFKRENQRCGAYTFYPALDKD